MNHIFFFFPFSISKAGFIPFISMILVLVNRPMALGKHEH